MLDHSPQIPPDVSDRPTPPPAPEHAPDAAAFPTAAELLDSMTDIGVVGLTVDGRVGAWNRAAQRLFGIARGDALGRSFDALATLPRAGNDDVASLLALAAAGGRAERTLPFARPDGESWLARVVVDAIRGADGGLRAYTLAAREVHRGDGGATGTAPPPRQLAQMLIDGVQDYAIFSLDASGHVTSWNKGAQRAKGYSAPEIVGRHFSVFYRPQEVERGWPDEELRRATELGRYEDEGWRVRQDGSLFWANVIITAIRDGRGALLGFSKVTRDLTERREHEEQLRQREEDFRMLVEGVHGHAMFLVDADGRIQTWNAGAQRLMGYEASQVVGHPTSVLYTEQDRNSAQFNLALQAAKLRGQVQFKAWRRRADGLPIWVEVNSTVLHDADGGCRGFVQVLRDLTESARVEALETEGRRTAEFIALLSHELRNPLAPIRNAATMLKRLPADRETTAWCADLVDRQVNHLARLVDDLLDVSRVTNGKIRVQSDECDLAAIVTQAVDSLRPTVAGHGHRLATQIDAGPTPLIGDATRLTQVVTNLLTNAAKYTAPSGTIEVTLRRDGTGWAALEVRDTGIGMSPTLLQRAFEPFVQGERALARSEGGLGVGLTLVKTIVQLHGGSVEAASAGEGRGTTFTVRLPVGTAPARADAPPPARRRARARASLRVLVVDDNTDAADSVAMMLRLEGHQVEVAYDGLAALAVAQRQRPEVAVLDIGLPGIDGYELARRLRGLSGLDHVRLIALTGYGQEQDIEAARAAGFEHHLAKPAPTDVLARLVAA